MCSSGGSIGTDDKALQNANLAANQNFLADARTAFAGQQNIIARQTAQANQMITNPMGYSPQELKIASSNINDNFARAAKGALGSAAAFAATHGGADVGGGGAAQMVGEIGTAEAGGAASARAGLAQQNKELQRQQMNLGLETLNQAGAGAAGATGAAISGAGTTGKTSVEAGTGADEAQKQAWSNFGSALGVAGSAVSAIPGL